MPDKDLPVDLLQLDEAKRERALKLLDETDPGLAKRFREELKKRSKRKNDLRTVDLLQLHPSFWSIRQGFYLWQLLRRKPEYCDAEVFKSRDSAVFTESFYSRFYENYPPRPNESFPRWSVRIIQKAGSTKALSGREREVILSPDYLPDTLRLRDRWPPVPPEIEFPHPHVLDRLTHSSIGVAVSTVPSEDMSKIQINGRSFWVDLNFSLKQICTEIFEDFGLSGWRSWAGSRENLTAEQRKARRAMTKELKSQLAALLRQRNRDTDQKRQRQRKRSPEPPKIARALVAWDLKQVGKSYRQIIEVLYPDELARLTAHRKPLRDAGVRDTLLDRAKEHVKYADKRIRSAFSIKKPTP
jgi:hypothetical protein